MKSIRLRILYFYFLRNNYKKALSILNFPASAYKLVIFRGRSKMIEQLNVDRKLEFKDKLLDMQFYREHQCLI